MLALYVFLGPAVAPPLFKFLNRHRAYAQHFSHQGYTKVHYLSSPAEHSNLDLDKKKLFHICPITSSNKN